MHDSVLVSLEHPLPSRHPCQSVEPTNPASIIFQEDKALEDKTLTDPANIEDAATRVARTSTRHGLDSARGKFLCLRGE